MNLKEFRLTSIVRSLNFTKIDDFSKLIKYGRNISLWNHDIPAVNYKIEINTFKDNPTNQQVY